MDHATGTLGADVRHLVEHLERLRTIAGDRPLQIISGWRSVGTNLAVGGASRSQHLYGLAADIPAGYATEAQARRAGFRGIGTRLGWAVHVDLRAGRSASWRYEFLA
jgi:uncharacterized protein YcbK (DUF882 family)